MKCVLKTVTAIGTIIFVEYFMPQAIGTIIFVDYFTPQAIGTTIVAKPPKARKHYRIAAKV